MNHHPHSAIDGGIRPGGTGNPCGQNYAADHAAVRRSSCMKAPAAEIGFPAAGATRRGKPRPTGKAVSEAEFRRMWCDESITATEIGRRLGISRQAVCIRAKTRGLPPRKGGAGRKRKLDPAMFRKLWDANVSPRDIARVFGCSPPTVTERARMWGFPPRDCHKWNVVSVEAFAMAISARAEQAAARALWRAA